MHDSGFSLAPLMRRLLMWLLVLSLFGAVFFLCRYFPIVGDDWYREALGREIHGLGDLIREVSVRWASTNGRILGNVLAYSAGSRPLLRELLRSAITVLTVYTAAKLCGGDRPLGLCLAFAMIFALPKSMFAQIYPWAAGFFNYVPPVLITLLFFCLIRGHFDGEPLPGGVLRSGAAFLLGFSGQLFVEHNTLFALAIGLILILWYYKRHRAVSAVLTAYFAGAVLGAALLFASPSYWAMLGGDAAYQPGFLSGLPALLDTVRTNGMEILRDGLTTCPVLYLGLTVLPLICLHLCGRRSLLDIGTAILLTSGCIIFLCDHLYGSLPAATRVLPPAVLLWLLALFIGLFRWISPGAYRSRALFFLFCGILAALPLLVVSPIGPRCLYFSYVLLAAVMGNLIFWLAPECFPGWARLAAVVLLLGLVFGFYLHLFLPMYPVALQRTELVENALSTGAQEVTLPSYPNSDYLWDANTQKIGIYYYHQEPGDITFQFSD